MTQAFDAAEQQALLEARVASALDLARRLGANACEVGASVDQGIGVSVRLGEVESVELSRDQGIAVTVFVGSRKGSASSSDAGEASIRAAVEKAIGIAHYTGEDPHAGLAPAELMATELPDLEVHHPWRLSTDEAIELALACESAGRGVAGISNSDGASLSSGEGVRVYGNSHGFLGSLCGSRHSLSCMLIAEDDSGMQRDYEYTSERDPARLVAAETVGRQAADKTLRRLGAKRPSTGRFPVLFDPQLAAGLIGHLMSAIAGGQCIATPPSCADASARRCSRAGSRLARGRWRSALRPVRHSTTTASTPAITCSSTRAGWPATCSRPIARGGLACTAPVTPVAPATCASRRR